MRLLVLVLLVCTIVACKKKEAAVEDGSNAYYTFTNHLNKPVTVKIFCDSDYTERHMTYLQIEPAKVAFVPSHVFYQTGSVPTRLGYCWATTDNQISNWSTVQWPKFWYDSAVPSRNIDIYGSDGDDKFGFFLSSIDKPAFWKAIDAFDSAGNSVWNALPAYKRKVNVELYWMKEMHVQYFTGDTTDVYDSYSFLVVYPKTGKKYIVRRDANGDFNLNYTSMMSDCRPNADLVTYQSGRAYLLIDNKPPYYLMAKQ
jgi:hypothetical protein